MNLNFPEQTEKICPPQEGFVSFIKNTASSFGRLTGFSNLTESVQAYRQKEYRKGTCSLAYGVTKMVVIGACIYKFFSMNKEIQQLRDSNDKNRSLQSENNQQAIDELKKRILELQRNILELQRNKEDTSKQLIDQNDIILDNKETINKLSKQINNLNSNNEECTKETVNQKKTIDECSKHVKERDQKIDQLNLKNTKCKIKRSEQQKILNNVVRNLDENPKKEEKSRENFIQKDTWSFPYSWSFPYFKRLLDTYQGIILVDPDIDRDSLLIYEDAIKNLDPYNFSDAQKIIHHRAFRNGNTWYSVNWAEDQKRCSAIKARFNPKDQTDVTMGKAYSQLLKQKIVPACETLLRSKNRKTNN